jgi:hypothetical protein
VSAPSSWAITAGIAITATATPSAESRPLLGSSAGANRASPAAGPTAHCNTVAASPFIARLRRSSVAFSASGSTATICEQP